MLRPGHTAHENFGRTHLLERVSDIKPDRGYFSRLTHAMDPCECLLLKRRVPSPSHLVYPGPTANRKSTTYQWGSKRYARDATVSVRLFDKIPFSME